MNNNDNRVKTGRISSRVEKMINQTLDNLTNNVNNNINNNENSISFYPEYKVLKKIENKRSSVDGIGNNNLNLNSDLNNNIQATRWIQLNKINTNKPPKNAMKLGDLLKDEK